MKRIFENMEQRAVFAYLDTFPAFTPDPLLPRQGQEDFYNLVKGLLQSLLHCPEALFPQLHEDNAHSNRYNKKADNNPRMYETMRRNARRLEELFDSLYEAGRSGSLEGDCLLAKSKLSRAAQKLLGEQGVSVTKKGDALGLQKENGRELFMVWQQLTRRPGACLTEFTRCMFNREYSYHFEIYRRLAGDAGAFDRLTAFLQEKGYDPVENADHKKISLDYIKQYGKKQAPLKAAWADRTYGGVSMVYDGQVWEPAAWSMRIPEIRPLLARFGRMEPSLQDFIVANTKHCDSCDYCTQTDKTGKRPRAAVAVNHLKASALCPYFPGYSFTWMRLTPDLVENMICLLEYMDQVLGADSKPVCV